jgi:Tol biopolymer transport system component
MAVRRRHEKTCRVSVDECTDIYPGFTEERVMRRKFTVSTALALAGLCILPVAGLTAETLVAYQRYAGKFAVMSLSGGSYTYVDCGGDMTYSGSSRYFTNVVGGTNQLPPSYFGGSLVYNTEIAASDTGCRQTLALTSEGNMLVDVGRWSPDGTMIATNAMFFDLANGTRTWQGIVIYDVMYSGGQPVAAVNLRKAIPTGGARNFTWSPDSGRIVYVEAGINGADLFSYSLDGGAVANLTNTPGVAEDQPAYSTRERIAYVRQTTDSRGSWRYDVYIIPATGGTEFQLTNKGTTGAVVNMTPCYSPDGLQVAFSSGLLQGDRALYRIAADGTGRAVKIAGAKGNDWRVCFWRP